MASFYYKGHGISDISLSYSVGGSCDAAFRCPYCSKLLSSADDTSHLVHTVLTWHQLLYPTTADDAIRTALGRLGLVFLFFFFARYTIAILMVDFFVPSVGQRYTAVPINKLW